jgi:predicted CoA-binding protein
LLGETVAASLADMSGPIDIVDVFRRAEDTPDVARQAVAAGAKLLWLQLGIVNHHSAEIALAGGLDVVMDRCSAIEARRLLRPR